MSRLRPFMARRDHELMITVDRRLRTFCFAAVQMWIEVVRTGCYHSVRSGNLKSTRQCRFTTVSDLVEESNPGALL